MTKQSTGQEPQRILSRPYRKQNLLVLIWILSWLWDYGPPMHREEDCLRQPFHFVFIFLGTPFCVCLYTVSLCFLFSPTNFSLIPRMGQAQSTLLSLVLNHFKDFH